eukprot:jgi/Chrzof1/2165/Cz11g04200.t1
MSASTASTCPAALPRTVGFVPVRTCRRQRFRKKLSCCAFLVHDDRATYLNEPFISVRPRRVSEKQPARQKSIQLQSINHIAVPTQDVDGLKQFYTEVLGFDLLPRPNFPFGGAWLRGGGGTIIHLIEHDPSIPGPPHTPAGIPSPPQQHHYPEQSALEHDHEQQQQQQQGEIPLEPWHNRRGRHLAFQVDDLIAAEHVLQQRGIDYDKFIVPGSGAYQIFFCDPEGNGIEIGDYHPIVASLETSQSAVDKAEAEQAADAASSDSAGSSSDPGAGSSSASSPAAEKQQTNMAASSPATADGQVSSGKSQGSSSSTQQQQPEKITTWQYGKTKDPGFGPWFVGLLFLPFLFILLLPFLPPIQ